MNADKRNERGRICIPGMRLSRLDDDHICGPGTHEFQGYIFASLVGILKMEEDTNTKAIKFCVTSPKTTSVLPMPGDIATAKVTVVNSRLVQCLILCVGPLPVVRPYRGILRKEDIRLTDKDKTDPYKCFRPGDIILARVLPMTEIHWYPLSTAENELGVVIASGEFSPQGVSMLPISWSEMQCPKTLIKEPRKVARVIPENFLEDLHPIDNKEEQISNGGV